MNGKAIALINIKNKISKGTLVVVFSRFLREPANISVHYHQLMLLLWFICTVWHIKVYIPQSLENHFVESLAYCQDRNIYHMLPHNTWIFLIHNTLPGPQQLYACHWIFFQVHEPSEPKQMHKMKCHTQEHLVFFDSLIQKKLTEKLVKFKLSFYQTTTLQSKRFLW